MAKKMQKNLYLSDWLVEQLEAEGLKFESSTEVASAAIFYFCGQSDDKKKEIVGYYKQKFIAKTKPEDICLNLKFPITDYIVQDTEDLVFFGKTIEFRKWYDDYYPNSFGVAIDALEGSLEMFLEFEGYSVEKLELWKMIQIRQGHSIQDVANIVCKSLFKVDEKLAIKSVELAQGDEKEQLKTPKKQGQPKSA